MAQKKKRRATTGQKSGKNARVEKKQSASQKARPRAKNSGAATVLPAATAMARRRAERMWLTKPSSRARVGKEVQALRDQIARDRARRHAEYLQQVDNPTEPPVALARESGIEVLRALAPAAGKRPLRILAEGDSWFDYPLPWPQGDGVIYQLQDLLGYPIDNMAHWGEELPPNART